MSATHEYQYPKNCPFCGCKMDITGREPSMRIEGIHKVGCFLIGAFDESPHHRSSSWQYHGNISAWNRRENE